MASPAKEAASILSALVSCRKILWRAHR